MPYMTNWELARCRGHSTLFFTDTPVAIATAKALCAFCPIKADCLDWALEHRECYGVWGGQTYEELRMTAALLGRKLPVRPGLEDIEHGTDKGYEWHKRTGIPIEYDEDGQDKCGCLTARRANARQRVSEYRKRVRASRVPRQDK